MEPRALRELLAENVRQLAGERGVTLNALADFAGVSRAQVYEVLAGRTGPGIDWIAKVAAALEVEPWELLAPTHVRQGRSRG